MNLQSLVYPGRKDVYNEKSLNVLWLLRLSGRMYCAYDVGFRCWYYRYGRGRMERMVELRIAGMGIKVPAIAKQTE